MVTIVCDWCKKEFDTSYKHQKRHAACNREKVARNLNNNKEIKVYIDEAEVIFKRIGGVWG